MYNSAQYPDHAAQQHAKAIFSYRNCTEYHTPLYVLYRIYCISGCVTTSQSIFNRVCTPLSAHAVEAELLVTLHHFCSSFTEYTPRCKGINTIWASELEESIAATYPSLLVLVLSSRYELRLIFVIIGPNRKLISSFHKYLQYHSHQTGQSYFFEFLLALEYYSSFTGIPCRNFVC